MSRPILGPRNVMRMQALIHPAGDQSLRCVLQEFVQPVDVDDLILLLFNGIRAPLASPPQLRAEPLFRRPDIRNAIPMPGHGHYRMV
ncbi:hypothetical protein D1872_277970 [compost metagenome]